MWRNESGKNLRSDLVFWRRKISAKRNVQLMSLPSSSWLSKRVRVKSSCRENTPRMTVGTLKALTVLAHGIFTCFSKQLRMGRKYGDFHKEIWGRASSSTRYVVYFMTVRC